MAGTAGRSYAGRAVVHIAVLAFVLVWTIPTLGILVSSLVQARLVRRFPQLTNEQRAERVAVIKAANRELSTLSASVRREFASIDNWKQLSGSKASVVSIIVAAIQRVDSASDVLMNKATQTVIQEVYAIEKWPTTKRVVLSRATASIRRLKLGGRLA